MNATPSKERRAYPRFPLTTSVGFYHGPSHRDFPARCIDISRGGMLMYVPATTPVQPGQPVRLAVGSVSHPDFARLGRKPLDAVIVRVDRGALLAEGHLAVGVRFAEA
jgi:c-di-GMP-binding flagellar brake protein YcgR